MWRNTFFLSTFRATLFRSYFRKMAIITSEAIHLDLCEMTYVLAAFGQPGCLTPPNAAGASNPKMKAGDAGTSMRFYPGTSYDGLMARGCFVHTNSVTIV